ncbi:MAG: hypothetical protein NZ602_17490 [Thermoguttaceae bacterium]|nr:hypothetical protein [Thermoguttaceae bacterium]
MKKVELRASTKNGDATESCRCYTVFWDGFAIPNGRKLIVPPIWITNFSKEANHYFGEITQLGKDH